MQMQAMWISCGTLAAVDSLIFNGILRRNVLCVANDNSVRWRVYSNGIADCWRADISESADLCEGNVWFT